MLVLSRKVGEKITIGNDVVITLVEIDRGKVRIGIQAPKEMFIIRSELIGDGGIHDTRRPRQDQAPSLPRGMSGFEVEDLCDLED